MATIEQIELSESKYIKSLGKILKDCEYLEIYRSYAAKRHEIGQLDRYKDGLTIKILQEEIYSMNIVLEEMENKLMADKRGIKN